MNNARHPDDIGWFRKTTPQVQDTALNMCALSLATCRAIGLRLRWRQITVRAGQYGEPDGTPMKFYFVQHGVYLDVGRFA